MDARLIRVLLPYAFRVVRRSPMPQGLRARLLRILVEINDILDAGGRWRSFLDSIDERHFVFDASRSREEKKRLFKSAVHMVEFEPHAYCNRQCPFCPNVLLDRINERSLMDLETYRRAVDELAEIDFDRTIRFARYCEPLACKEIDEYVAIARRALPNADIDIVTNGDYLNRDLLERLAQAGLSTLRISVYPKGFVWNHANALAQIEKICANIGIEPELAHREAGSITWTIAHARVSITAKAEDLATTGNDRGQSLADMIDSDYQRTSPCPFVFNNLTVDYDRSVMPCCNLRADMPEHKKYVVDTLGPATSLFDVYCSEALTGWRRSMVRVDRKAAPCNTCKHRVVTSPVSSFLLKREVGERLRRLGGGVRPSGRAER